MQQIEGLYFGFSEKGGDGGRGVFCAKDIPEGSIIELAPVIKIPENEIDALHSGRLHDYYFLWGQKEAAICLGYGSLYNHSEQPNADYQMILREDTIRFFAVRDIPAGEEILISYTHQNQKDVTLWFKAI